MSVQKARLGTTRCWPWAPSVLQRHAVSVWRGQRFCGLLLAGTRVSLARPFVVVKA